MKIQEVILSDFRNLCAYTREHEGFKPLSKSLLTKPWATSDEEYRNILCEALKYYFSEKDFRRIIRDEMKFDESQIEFNETHPQSDVVSQNEVVVFPKETVDNLTENLSETCNTSLVLV